MPAVILTGSLQFPPSSLSSEEARSRLVLLAWSLLPAPSLAVRVAGGKMGQFNSPLPWSPLRRRRRRRRQELLSFRARQLFTSKRHRGGSKGPNVLQVASTLLTQSWGCPAVDRPAGGHRGRPAQEHDRSRRLSSSLPLIYAEQRSPLAASPPRVCQPLLCLSAHTYA